MTLNFFYHFQLIPFQKYSTLAKYYIQHFFMDGLKLLSFNPAKTEFLLIGLPAQLSKIHNPKLTISSYTTILPVSSAQNLGIIFDSNLSFSDHISYISKSCFSHIRDLRRIRNTLNHKTACTIATSLIHSKLDYCNSLFSQHQ